LASVIIPAHDEASVIERCLWSFRSCVSDFEVIVVCNGCTDDTADRARAFDDVRVIEIDAASKVLALNAGDAAATVLPRIYIDADVQIDPEAVRAVAQALIAGAPASAPLLVMDMSRSTLAVRAYFSIWRRLGYANDSMLGSGVYGLSAEGRARFGEFPDLISDDGFVYSHFAPTERVNPPGARFTTQAPRTLYATFRRRIRTTQGNKQLTRQTGRRIETPPPNWRDVLRRRPYLLPAAFVFLPVNLAADRVAERRLHVGRVEWNRDDSRGV
jgi:glycosyltransferase involved in cell wall biosynthesis